MAGIHPDAHLPGRGRLSTSGPLYSGRYSSGAGPGDAGRRCRAGGAGGGLAGGSGVGQTDEILRSGNGESHEGGGSGGTDC